MRYQFAERLEARHLLSNLPPGFVEEVIPGNLNNVAGMDVTPDGRVLICEQGGKLRVVQNGQLLDQPMLTLAVDTWQERGLSNVKVDPNFAINGYIYVWYNTPRVLGGPTYNRLERYTVTGNTASPASAVTLFQTEALSMPIHNAGAMDFGPDGMLYFTHGHGSYGMEPQNLNSTMGKILRITPDGTIPEDNPFYNQTTGIYRAIWARGFRNPYSMQFKPGTNHLFVSDVGGAAWEEVNEAVAGGNYGWPVHEGLANDPSYTDPIYAFDHTGGCAIIGASFYNPATSSFPPEYQGKFFFSDFAFQWIRVMDPDTHQVSTFASDLPNFRTALAVSPEGYLYFTVRKEPGEIGAVHRIRYTGSLAPSFAEHPEPETAAEGDDVTFKVKVNGTGPFTYQWLKDSAEIEDATSDTLILSSITAENAGEYACRVTNEAGTVLSNPAALNVVAGEHPVLDITLPAEGVTFRAGDIITFSAVATDAEDLVLPPSSVSWSVEFGHDAHRHPFVPLTTGLSGTFQLADAGEADPDVYYIITVTATDSSGLKTVATRRIEPLLSDVTLATNIPGLTLDLDGQPHAAPYTFTGVEKLRRLISATNLQRVGEDTYLFVGWSQGGSREQEIQTPLDDSTYTAMYRKIQPSYLSDLPIAYESNGRGPIERDTHNGGVAPGDGGPITLNGKVFARGLGTYAPADVKFDLHGQYTRFLATIGIDDIAVWDGSVYFEVWLDGVRAYRSPLIGGLSAPVDIDIPVTGKQELRLVVEDEETRGNDYADWADAFLVAAARVLDITAQRDGDLFAIAVDLSDDFGASLLPDDFVLENTDDNSVIPLTESNLQYHAAEKRLNIVFPELPQTLLPNGNYRLTLNKPDFVDVSGAATPLYLQRDLFVLQGDANRDGIVDTADFNVLAGHFGLSSATFSQGDFSYDDVIDSVDFDLFVTNYGVRVVSVAPPPSGVPGPFSRGSTIDEDALAVLV